MINVDEARAYAREHWPSPVVHCHQSYQDDELDWDKENEETDYCPNCGAKMDWGAE